MRTQRIDCARDDWENILENAVQSGKEVELANFDYATGGQLCEMLAIGHKLRLVLDPKARAGFFQKRP
jgi:hypothetical protein